MKTYSLNEMYKVILGQDNIVWWNKGNKFGKSQLNDQQFKWVELMSKGKYLNENDIEDLTVFYRLCEKIPCIISSDYYTLYHNSKYDRSALFFRNITGRNEDHIKCISEKKVMVIGLGGVGCCIIDHLSRIGVSNYVIIDFDNVDESNLNRQAIYRKADVGKAKVDVIEAYLLENDVQSVAKYKLKIDNENDLLKIIDENPCDIIINGADYPLFKIDCIIMKGALYAECCYAEAKVGLEVGKWCIIDDYSIMQNEIKKRTAIGNHVLNQNAIRSSLGVWNNLVVDSLTLDICFYIVEAFERIRAYNKCARIEIWREKHGKKIN